MTPTYTAYCPLGHSTILTLEEIGQGLHPPCFCGRETTIYRRGAEPKPPEKLNFVSKSTEPNKGNQRHD